MSEKIHVYPLNDLAPHNTTSDICPCNPLIDENIIIHNSFDERERKEMIEHGDVDPDYFNR